MNELKLLPFRTDKFNPASESNTDPEPESVRPKKNEEPDDLLDDIIRGSKAEPNPPPPPEEEPVKEFYEFSDQKTKGKGGSPDKVAKMATMFLDGFASRVWQSVAQEPSNEKFKITAVERSEFEENFVAWWETVEWNISPGAILCFTAIMIFGGNGFTAFRIRSEKADDEAAKKRWEDKKRWENKEMADKNKPVQTPEDIEVEGDGKRRYFKTNPDGFYVQHPFTGAILKKKDRVEQAPGYVVGWNNEGIGNIEIRKLIKDREV